MNRFCSKLPLDIYPLKVPLPTITAPHALISFDQTDISDELKHVLDARGITGFALQGFFTAKNIVRTRCHIDTPLDGPVSRGRMNYILGGSSSYMSWYSVSLSEASTLITGGVPYVAFDIDKCTLLHTQSMSGWWAVETAIAHVAQNPSQDDRWCISIIPFTNERCSLDDIASLFQT